MRRVLLLLTLLALALAVPAQADDTLTVLHSFDQTHLGLPGGSNLALIQGSDGNFYGVTYGNDNVTGVYGTIYRLTPDGTYTTIHTFNRTDGAYPTSALVQGGDGSLYGTTYRGGPDDQGTVFRLTPDGRLTTLHAFSFDGVGYAPSTGLTRGGDGNFYGLTSSNGVGGVGIFYRVTPAGMFTVLHEFTETPAIYPNSAPVLAGDGNFYFTVSFYNNYLGAVFRLTPDGTPTLFHLFADIDGGTNPGPLTRGSDGNLYGVTFGGGPDDGTGTVFRLALDGTFTTLHSFTASPAGYTPDGNGPFTGVIQDGDGNLYGATYQGYDNDNTSFSGTVFRLAPDGALTTLHKFTQNSVGGGLVGKLLLGGDGALYGITAYGGANQDGSVFRVTTDSVAPVVSLPVDFYVPAVDLEAIRSDKITDTELGGFQFVPSTAQTVDLKVNYQVTGTGQPGVDYVALKGVVKIKAGKTYKNLNLIPIAIPHVPGQGKTVKTVKVTLLPGDGYKLRPEFTTRKVKITHP